MTWLFSALRSIGITILACCILQLTLTYTVAAEQKKDFEKPVVQYVPGEILIKLTPQGKNEYSKFEKPSGQSVTVNDIPTQNALTDLLRTHNIRKIEKLFKDSRNPQDQVTVLKQRYSRQLSSGRRRINENRLRSLDLTKYVKLTFDPSIPLEKKLEEFKGNPLIEAATPNYIAEASVLPNDPLFLDTYPTEVSERDQNWLPAFDYQWNLKKIQLPQAWDITTGSSEVVVAVIDSGVDYTHQELGSCTLEQVNANQCSLITPGYNFVNNDNDPMDNMNHGTHVAGLITGSTNNSIGIAFPNWKTKIMPVKVLDSFGHGTSANVAAGIVYAADQGAEVINLSLGATIPKQDLLSSPYTQAIEYAYSLGVVIVTAAGNDGLPAEFSHYDYFNGGFKELVHTPAILPEVIKVGATDETGSLTRFSTFDFSDFFVTAPGGGSLCNLGHMLSASSCYNILSLKTAAISGNSPQVVKQTYLRLAGTSMSAPLVSAIAALLKGYHAELTNQEIMKAIAYSADDKGTPAFDKLYGYGQVNAYKALRYLDQPTTPPPIPSPSPSQPPALESNIPLQQSLKLSGSECFDKQYVTVPSAPSIEINGEQTLEFWFKINNISNNFFCGQPYYQTLITKSTQINPPGVPNTLPYWIYINQERQLTFATCEFDVSGSEDECVHLVSREILQAQTWYHLAVTYNGQILSFFLNGKLIDSFPTKQPIDNFGEIMIGYYRQIGFPFQGEIDELRISNSIRYTQNFTPLSTPFTPDANTGALWHFDGTVLDTSSHMNQGTAFGQVTYVDSTVPHLISTSPIPTSCKTDINNDKQINYLDLVSFLTQWGMDIGTTDPAADNKINSLDFVWTVKELQENCQP